MQSGAGFKGELQRGIELAIKETMRRKVPGDFSGGEFSELPKRYRSEDHRYSRGLIPPDERHPAPVGRREKSFFLFR